MAQELYELDPEEFFRTNDMAMATYLKMTGFPSQQVKLIGGTCYWIFRVSDQMLDEMEKFQAGEATVEPKEYNRIYSLTKKEFYDAKEMAAATKHAAAG